LKARPYTTDAALADTYRTTLLSYGLRAPEPSMWMLSGSSQDAIFTPWNKHLALLAGTTFEVKCPKVLSRAKHSRPQ
jgi:hypothetical protein